MASASGAVFGPLPESEIYVSKNRLADGLDYLASLARLPVPTSSPRAAGRQRTAGGVDQTAVRVDTSSLAAQICTPVCTKVSEVRYFL